MAQESVAGCQPPYMTPPVGDDCPVERIPDEIILYIFTIIVAPSEIGIRANPDTSEEGGKASPSTLVGRKLQDIIAHVCGRWRAIALEMPSLWKCIDFTDGPPFDRSQAWIKRTKDYPLDIVLQCKRTRSIGFEDEESHIDPCDLPAILDIILPRVSRWGSFSFAADDTREINDMVFALSTAGEASELKSMILSYRGALGWYRFVPFEVEEQLYVPFRGRAPKLLKLELDRVHLDWAQSSFFHGSSLAHLKVISNPSHLTLRPSFHDFTRTLGGCSNLSQLSLTNFGPSEDVSSWPTGSVTELPSLKRLTLSSFNTFYLAGLLRHLRFPNLRVMMAMMTTTTHTDDLVASLCSAISPTKLVDLQLAWVHIAKRERDAAANRLLASIECLDGVLHIDRITTEMVFNAFTARWKQMDDPRCGLTDDDEC
ncbi:hypothetical protein BDY19DRAFT_84329 [Irpex rosettiformis]|uniref:Uncharacterized protein n=1 Tax=Irpex rosettiformis TaxID=378272 RepID=A0ACB8U619_9APHY|nr:hypothetical protein BDY19DRAFT_84329 [Irpex rosettiformis]